VELHGLDGGLEGAAVEQFADDVGDIMSLGGQEQQQLATAGLQAIMDWARLHQMKQNASKTQALTYRRDESAVGQVFAPVVYAEEGGVGPLPPVQEVCHRDCTVGHQHLGSARDLGVWQDPHMAFKDHMRKVIAGGKMTSAWLLRSFRSREVRVLLLLLKSIIVPKMEYACLVWSPSTVGAIQEMEQVQKSFTANMRPFRHRHRRSCPQRCMLRTTRSYHERLERLRIYSLQRRRERYHCIYAYHIITGWVPRPKGFQFHETSRHGIRVEPMVAPHGTPTSLRRMMDNSPVSRMARSWNAMSSFLKGVSSFQCFQDWKKALTTWLSRVQDHPYGPWPGSNNTLAEQARFAKGADEAAAEDAQMARLLEGLMTQGLDHDQVDAPPP